MTFVQFTKRTEDPKLAYIEKELTQRGIVHRRSGSSWHAPILEVDETRLADAELFLQENVDGRNFDSIEDDDPLFLGACCGDCDAEILANQIPEDDADEEEDVLA